MVTPVREVRDAFLIAVVPSPANPTVPFLRAFTYDTRMLEKRPPLYLLTINKQSGRTDYNRDVLTTLALPYGAMFRFRYRLRYIDRAVGAAAQIRCRTKGEPTAPSDNEIESLQRELTDRDAWIILFDEETGKYVPLRKVITTRAVVTGLFVSINFRLEEFAEYPREYRELVEPPHVASSSNLFCQPYDMNRHALVVEGEPFPERTPDAHDEEWQRVVVELQKVRHYDACTYVAVLGISRADRPDEEIPMTADGAYLLPSATAYVLQLQHSRQSRSDAMSVPSVRITAFADHLVTSHADMKLNGSYDVSRLRFVVKKRLDTVVSYLGLRSDNPGLADFELPLKLSKRLDTFDWFAMAPLATGVVFSGCLVVYVWTNLDGKEIFLALGTFIAAIITSVQRFTPKDRG
jgi:hypothetical protein